METLPIQPTTMWINNSRKKTTGNWEKSQELHLDYHEEATTFGDDLYSIYVPGQGVTYPPWNQQLTCRPNHPPPKKCVHPTQASIFQGRPKFAVRFKGEFRTSSMPKHQTRQESRNIFGRSKADRNDFFHSWPWWFSSSSLCFASKFFLRIKVETPPAL